MQNHAITGIWGICCALTLTAGLLFAPVAQAQSGHHAVHSHKQFNAQHSYTRTTQTQRTANGHSRSSVYTDAKGRTATRQTDVANDRANGTRTRDTHYTGRDGRTRSSSSVAEKTETGHSKATTYTDKNGHVATKSTTVSRDKAAGTAVRDTTFVGRDGATSRATTLTQRTDDGFTRNTQTVAADGSSATRNVDVVHDRDTHSTTRSVAVEVTPAP